MVFMVVISAQCISIMISATAIACIRKQHIIFMVVANPVAASIGLHEPSGLAT